MIFGASTWQNDCIGGGGGKGYPLEEEPFVGKEPPLGKLIGVPRVTLSRNSVLAVNALNASSGKIGEEVIFPSDFLVNEELLL